MLLNDLYTIQSITEMENHLLGVVKLKKDHAIFKGHFPGQPVLPGVCMMEMIAEIMSQNLKDRYRISAAPLVKFLRMIDPGINEIIQFEIFYQLVPGGFTANGKFFLDKDIFMKFNLNFTGDQQINNQT